MPGPIVHLIVQQRLARALHAEPEGKELAKLLDSGGCDPFAAFGSMGPDYLFFSLKEYGTPLDELVHFLFGVYDAFRPLIDFYEKNIEPIVEDVEDAIDAVDDALFAGIFQQIDATSKLAVTTLLTAAAAGLTKGIDLFYGFYPKLQAGAAEKDWYWFDFLHYRRTGEFCTSMWNNAKTDKDLRRYCLGYASHIAVDVVGHPFVNTIVGGPYRVHWHRHKLVENWIDAYARNHYPDSRRTKRCLQLQPDDVYVPDAISGSLYYRLLEFPNGTLPQKLADLIVTAMDEVYVTPPAANPTPMTAGDLDDTYRLWLEWFRRATTVLDARKPIPVPPPGTAAITLVTDFVNGFPPFPGASGPPSGGFSPAAILAALAAFAQWVADSVSYTTNWAANHAHDIVTLPVTAGHELTKWLLYQVQKGLWEVYDNVRFALVLGGYIFPEQRDLAKAPWGMALTRSGPVHPRWNLYPRKQEAHGLTGPMEHHLIYPNEPSELPYAEPMPEPFHTQPPEAFITDSWPYDPVIEMLWQCTDPYGPTDAFTHTVDSMTWNTAQFGSALSFSARLIAQRMNNMPNFNLDGDRGYGWKTWRAVKPDIENQGGPTQPPLDVTDYGIA